MTKTTKYTSAVVVLLVVAALGIGVGSAMRAPPGGTPLTAIGDNLLLNPGFEGTFTERGAGEVKVAAGWEPWWLPGVRPEYKDAAPYSDRIHSGDHAQQFFTTYATHTAGIYQRVDVPVGSTLTFSAYIHAWSQFRNGSQGRYRMKIGVDPYGGIDPESPDIVWSDGGNAVQPYQGYTKLSVETLARSDRATVFVWGQAEWATQHNNAYMDSASLTATTPEPLPTPTPLPSGEIDYDQIRAIIREELDATRLGH